MVMKTVSPAAQIFGVPIVFDKDEVEAFFVEVKRTPRGAGKRRKFSMIRLREKLGEKTLRTILDYHHGALAMKREEVEALFRRSAILGFSLSREKREYAGQCEIRIEYRVGTSPGQWRHTFHFVRDKVASTGERSALNGRLFTSSRRFYGN